MGVQFRGGVTLPSGLIRVYSLEDSPTSLNPADVGTGLYTPSLVAVSGVLLESRPIGGLTSFGNVRAFGGKTSGKWYFEVYTYNGADGQIGVIGGSVSLNQHTFFADKTAVVGGVNGAIAVNGTTVGSVTPVPQGRMTRVAYDADLGKVWIGTGNLEGSSTVWGGTGTQNPATGEGGFSFTPGEAVYAHLAPYHGLLGSTFMRANFGQTPYVFARPSGFRNWTME